MTNERVSTEAAMQQIREKLEAALKALDHFADEMTVGKLWMQVRTELREGVA